MKKLTRTIAAVSALAMSVGALSACGGSNVNADKGHVYFLSMKVEQQDQFKELAEKFTKKTGIQVDIATASSDTYEQSLKSELAKSEAPTLFDVGIGLIIMPTCREPTSTRIRRTPTMR